MIRLIKRSSQSDAPREGFMFHRISALASVAALAASVTMASAQDVKLPPT